MLHKPDVNVDRIMKLADFIGGLEHGSSFSMKSWGSTGEPRCICGWLSHQEGHSRYDDVSYAADLLGISFETACKLFDPKTDYTPKEAAAALRHLAVTGELP